MPYLSHGVLLNELRNLELGSRRPKAVVGVPRAGKAKRIAILGAGMSGLCAARRLAQMGHDVRVLEARSRPGGRIRTIRVPFQDGQYAESAAYYILGNQPKTCELIRAFGLKPILLPDTDTLLHLHGATIAAPNDPHAKWPVALTAIERAAGLGRMMSGYLMSDLDAIGDPHDPDWPPPAATKLDRISLYEYLRRRGASDAAIDVIRTTGLEVIGEGIESCSALFFLRELRLIIPPGATTGRKESVSFPDPRAIYTIQDGMEQFVNAFVADPGLQGRILCSSPVRRISAKSDGVEVVYETDGVERCESFDRVVTTIPFSVLRRWVRLDLPLSDGKCQAIQGSRHTSLMRIFLQATPRFWGNRMIRTDLPLMTADEMTTVQKPDEVGILSCCLSGRYARQLEALSNDERVTRAWDWVRQILPTRARLVAGTSISWDGDPWSGGGFIYYQLGEMTTLFQNVATPEGRLHFAGDQTSVEPGWIEGALQSADRVADEINAIP